jgi:hypothetical protein
VGRGCPRALRCTHKPRNWAAWKYLCEMADAPSHITFRAPSLLAAPSGGWSLLPATPFPRTLSAHPSIPFGRWLPHPGIVGGGRSSRSHTALHPSMTRTTAAGHGSVKRVAVLAAPRCWPPLPDQYMLQLSGRPGGHGYPHRPPWEALQGFECLAWSNHEPIAACIPVMRPQPRCKASDGTVAHSLAATTAALREPSHHRRCA